MTTTDSHSNKSNSTKNNPKKANIHDIIKKEIN